MKAKAKRMSWWALGILAVFAMGLYFGGGRPAASAQTELHVEGRYVILDKTLEEGPGRYAIFDTESGVLREWTGQRDGTVVTYSFRDPEDIIVNDTSVRRR